VQCPECEHEWLSRTSGGTTTCGECGTRVYVPAGRTRALAPVDCLHCGQVWNTRAGEGSTLRCPHCGRRRRVPAGIRAPMPPAPRQAPVRASRERQARDRAAWAAVSGSGTLGGLMGSMGSGLPVWAGAGAHEASEGHVPAPRRAEPPRPSTRTAATVPAPVAGIRPGSKSPVGPRTSRVLRESGAWPNTPHLGRALAGQCPLTDAAGRPCQVPATIQVLLSPAAWLPVCSPHRHALFNRAGDAGTDTSRWQAVNLRTGSAA